MPHLSGDPETKVSLPCEIASKILVIRCFSQSLPYRITPQFPTGCPANDPESQSASSLGHVSEAMPYFLRHRHHVPMELLPRGEFIGPPDARAGSAPWIAAGTGRAVLLRPVSSAVGRGPCERFFSSLKIAHLTQGARKRSVNKFQRLKTDVSRPTRGNQGSAI